MVFAVLLTPYPRGKLGDNLRKNIGVVVEHRSGVSAANKLCEFACYTLGGNIIKKVNFTKNCGSGEGVRLKIKHRQKPQSPHYTKSVFGKPLVSISDTA
jgi:hypothetical protein